MSENIKVEMFTNPKSFQPMARIIVELPMEITDPTLSKTEGYKKLSDEIVRLLAEYDEKRATTNAEPFKDNV